NSIFFFSSRRRHTRSKRDWSSDVCSSDLNAIWSARPQHVAPVAQIARLIASHAGKPRVAGEASIPTVAASGRNGGHVVVGAHDRSEERRVGKECRSGRSTWR